MFSLANSTFHADCCACKRDMNVEEPGARVCSKWHYLCALCHSRKQTCSCARPRMKPVPPRR